MKVESAEICLVVFIGAIQIIIFLLNVLKTGRYEKVIPNISCFSIIRVPITEDLQNLTDKSAFSSENLQRPQQMSLFAVSTDQTHVNLIVCSTTNDVLDDILYSTNTYLLKNNMAAADFHLMKDIAERNIDALEEDINLTISIPLYLGLMATMLGIVIGLFNMPDLNLKLDAAGKDLLLNDGITLLIGGVKIAMIASFIGLALTIGSSGFIFKGSRSIVEQRKNAYYTFLQTALLPIMNQSIGATLTSLQLNLLKFNHEFSNNLERLSGLFENNFEALQLQEKVLKEINNLDMVKLSRFNLDMFREVEAAAKEFEKFNKGMANLNGFVENSQLLVVKVTELMQRSDNFEKIANHLEDKLESSSKLLEFLGNHFADLEAHKDLVNISVVEAANYISGLFKELQAHFKASSESLKTYTIDEIAALKKALSDSRTSLSNLEFLQRLDELGQLSSLKQLEGLSQLGSLNKLSELSKLGTLQEISNGVSTFNENAAFQATTSALLMELNANMGAAITLMEQIQNEAHSGISHTIRKWFNREK